jgi:outer membrane protein OmpA-like peptidoglycan-associated protein
MKKCFSSSILGAAMALLIAGQASAAVKYVQMDTIESVVTEGVRDCRAGAGSKVPLITWGADMITLYANGDKLTTQPNSVFDKAGLKLTLKRVDVFTNQVASYLRCDTPYLRGTQGQLNLAAGATEKDPRTRMVTIYQHSWSLGGDGLAGKKNIKTPADLKGKTIAVQAYGPHIAYALKILADAGISPDEVTFKYTKDLVGFDGDSTPGAAFLDDKDVDAAMVIITDALKLTSGGNVGTGAEGSVKGAKIILSTKTASRVISDVYAVRADYLKANRKEVQAFVKGLLIAEERLVAAARAKNDAFKKTVAAGANILLGVPTAISDAEGLWSDAETTGINGNVKFFTNTAFPRNFTKITAEIQSSYVKLGLLSKTVALADAGWNYSVLAKGLKSAGKIEAPRFNTAKITAAVTAKAAAGDADAPLFTFQINFAPNQKVFSAEAFADSFNKVIKLSATYAGAVLTVEGHADPYGFQKKKANGASASILSRIRQSAKSLSVTRAGAVRGAVLAFAKQRGVIMDQSQFVTIGYGISRPKIEKMPTSKAEWVTTTRANRRVVFKLINVEAESAAFEKF